MAVKRKMPATNDVLFPSGAFLLGGVEQVLDFQAPQRPDGSRPQQVDKETGLPLWQVPVLDADPEAGNREKTIVVKLASQYQPVPPENTTGLPFTPVRFTGLTLTPWIDENGPRPKLAWSVRATGFEDASPSARRDQGKAA
ncbi:plasmid replication, integration and excision activator [Luteococcus sp.]|uniref:plasmid replication, integration and excision activator n=1 Tax=Luteococcus sp. TaxID=1969402 RepID=UPI003736CDF0